MTLSAIMLNELAIFWTSYGGGSGKAFGCRNYARTTYRSQSN